MENMKLSGWLLNGSVTEGYTLPFKSLGSPRQLNVFHENTHFWTIFSCASIIAQGFSNLCIYTVYTYMGRHIHNIRPSWPNVWGGYIVTYWTVLSSIADVAWYVSDWYYNQMVERCVDKMLVNTVITDMLLYFSKVFIFKFDLYPHSGVSQKKEFSVRFFPQWHTQSHSQCGWINAAH